MKKVFESIGLANQDAENHSLKSQCSTYVTKENAGGLRWCVYIRQEDIPSTAKIVSEYAKGKKVK